MGVYIYTNHPSKMARALVEFDGVEQEMVIGLYRYAYKPYHWDEKLNARMAFRSGAAKNAAAWDLTLREMPKYGVNYDDERGEVADPADNVVPFFFGGANVGDDWVKYDKEARIVRWLKLPKGVKVAAPSKLHEEPL